MKKLTALLTVFAMSSLSNAAIVISVNGSTTRPDVIMMPVGDTVTIGIYNLGDLGPNPKTPINFEAYLDFRPNNRGGYTFSNARWGPAAGDFRPVNPSMASYGAPDYYDEWTVGQNWNPPKVSGDPAGAIFLVDLHKENIVDIFVELWDGRAGYVTPVDTLTIVAPEPAMIALLGLGALTLRKKG